MVVVVVCVGSTWLKTGIKRLGLRGFRVIEAIQVHDIVVVFADGETNKNDRKKAWLKRHLIIDKTSIISDTLSLRMS